MLRLGDGERAAVGRDHRGRHEAVAREAAGAREPADAAPEREARHARVAHEPRRDVQAQGRRGGVHVGPQRPSADGGGGPPAVGARAHDDGPVADVDEHGVVGDREAGHAVPPAAHRGGEAAPRAGPHRGHRVSGAGARDDGRGEAVNVPVPDPPRLVVPRPVLGREHRDARLSQLGRK